MHKQINITGTEFTIWNTSDKQDEHLLLDTKTHSRHQKQQQQFRISKPHTKNIWSHDRYYGYNKNRKETQTFIYLKSITFIELVKILCSTIWMAHTSTRTTPYSRHYKSFTPHSTPSHVIQAGLVTLNAHIYIHKPPKQHN